MTAENPEPKTPAERIIARFGVARLAAWTGRHRTRVHAWAWGPENGGTGGVIPPRLRPKIIEGAKRDLHEVLTYADFEPQGAERYLVAEQSSDPDALAQARAM